jgi:hypothetical protein
MGILEPSGKPHPGKGYRNQYGGDVLLKAVILQTLIDALGAPATALAELADKADSMILLAVRRGERPELLLIGRGSTQEKITGLFVFTTPKKLAEYYSDPEFDTFVVLKLKRIFELADIAPRKPF